MEEFDEGLGMNEEYETSGGVEVIYSEEQESMMMRIARLSFTVSKGRFVELDITCLSDAPTPRRVDYNMPKIEPEDEGWEDFADGGRSPCVSRKVNEEIDRENRKFRRNLLDNRWGLIKPPTNKINYQNRDHINSSYVLIRRDSPTEFNFRGDGKRGFSYIVRNWTRTFIAVEGPFRTLGEFTNPDNGREMVRFRSPNGFFCCDKRFTGSDKRLSRYK